MPSPRHGLRIGATIGAVSLAVLACGPAFAADPTSQASAQSLNLTIAGTDAVTQTVTATNDGSGEVKNDASTLPTIAGVLPENNLLSAGVAPQDAGANSDGTSWACAGIAGEGSTGIVTTGDGSCDIDGQPLTLNLADLTLGDQLLDTDSVLGDALNQVGLGTVLNQITGPLSDAVNQATAAIPISIGGTVSAIEAECQANPTKATGDAHLVDTAGGDTVPISATIAGQNIVIANLPVNPAPNTHVLTDLDEVTQTVITALTTELDTAVGGALQQAAGPLGGALQQVQDLIVSGLVDQLQPLLQPLQQNVLDITLNKQSTGDDGRSIDVTALDLQVLPAAQQFVGSSLISGQLGHVTCGPNTARTTTPPADNPNTPADNPNPPADNPNPPADHNVPVAVNAGLESAPINTAGLFFGLGALAVAGLAGTVTYRRLLQK